MRHDTGCARKVFAWVVAACVMSGMAAGVARAGDYDADIWDALKIVNEKAGQTGMLEEGRKKYNDLMTKYADERAKLMEEMLAALGKQDLSDLRDVWAKKNEKGKELLERLNREVPKVGDKEGLVAAGIESFAQGERKVWELNQKADVAIMAEIMIKILKLDLELIKKTEADLKSVRDNDRALEAQLAQCENEILASAKEIVGTLTKKLAQKVLTSWIKDEAGKDYAKKEMDRILKNTAEIIRVAKEKRTIQGVMLDDIRLMEKAQERLSPGWIEEVYKKGESFSKDLASVGAGGDYKAADWRKFGEAATKLLAEHRSRSIEQSKKVFNELLPTFREELKKKFATFMNDPSKLADWEKQVDEEFKTMDETLAKQEELTNALAEGPYKAAAKASLSDMRLMLKVGWDLVRSGNKKSKDEMEK
jgi:hypothetical protein